MDRTGYQEDILSFWIRPIQTFLGIKGRYMNNKWTVNMNYRCELMEASIVWLDIGSGKCLVC
jgi:hypothetical protein